MRLGSHPLSGCIRLLVFPVPLFSPYKSGFCGPCRHIPSTSRQVASLRGPFSPWEGSERPASAKLKTQAEPSAHLTPCVHTQKETPWPLRSLHRRREGETALSFLFGDPNIGPAETLLKPSGPGWLRAWLLTFAVLPSHSLSSSSPLCLLEGRGQVFEL